MAGRRAAVSGCPVASPCTRGQQAGEGGGSRAGGGMRHPECAAWHEGYREVQALGTRQEPAGRVTPPPFSCRDRSGIPWGGRPSCTGGKTHAHHQSQGWGEPSAQQTRLNTRRPHVPVAVPGACSQTLGPGCASGSRFLREPRGPGTPRPAAAHTRDPQSRPARLRSRPSRLLAEPRQSGCRAADPRRRGSPAPSRGEPHAP